MRRITDAGLELRLVDRAHDGLPHDAPLRLEFDDAVLHDVVAHLVVEHIQGEEVAYL